MNFPRLIQTLIDADVKFVIVGGWSAILHGSSHTTRDMDLCFSRDRTNLKKLVLALAPFHPRLRDFPAGLPFVWDEATLRNGTLFTLSTDLGSVDLLGEVLGVGDFKQVLEVSVELEAFDRRIWTLDLPALINPGQNGGRTPEGPGDSSGTRRVARSERTRIAFTALRDSLRFGILSWPG